MDTLLKRVKRYEGIYSLPVIDGKITIPSLILKKILNNRINFRMLTYFPYFEDALACMTNKEYEYFLQNKRYEYEFDVDKGIYLKAKSEKLFEKNRIIIPEHIKSDTIFLLPDNRYFLIYPEDSYKCYENSMLNLAGNKDFQI